MHHRRQKTVSSPNSSSKGQRDSGYESMQRLRYLNKKPLCLQYNMLGGYAKRNSMYKPKRKEEALIIAIAIGLVKLLIWLAAFIKKELWNFLTKPAEQLFPVKKCGNRGFNSLSTSAYHQRRRFRRSIRRYYQIRNSSPEMKMQTYDRDLSTRRTMRFLTTYGGQSPLCLKQTIS
ncbi:unnamed protein product [Auanema sp. JU1783]|nr:unnamed protein product [Auanema sp. JU1783]